MTSNLYISEYRYKPNEPHRLRVADILLLDEDEGDFDCGVSMDEDKGLMGGGCVGGVDYWSPRRVIGRWLKRLREKKVAVGSGRGKKERDDLGDGLVPTRCSTNCPTGGGALGLGFKESDDGSEASGSCAKEASFNIGVGFSLLYLIANSKNELNKMAELRTQMENFLQLAEEELHKKEVLSNKWKSVAYSTTDIPEGSNSNSNFSVQFSATSYAVPESEPILECDQSSRRDSPKLEYSVEERDQLEEELEAELECLQLHLETETLLEHPQLERIEVTVNENNVPIESHSTSGGEVNDPQEGGTEEYYDGVPPYVLERRLHELLEARQEEHIQELEAALKCFQQKLQEKERELSWWKDTARLISRRIPGKDLVTH